MPTFDPDPRGTATVDGRRLAAILLRDRPAAEIRRPLRSAALRVAAGALAAGAAGPQPRRGPAPRRRAGPARVGHGGPGSHPDPAIAARRLAVLVTSLREAYETASGEPGPADEVTERVLRAERAARQALAGLTPVGPQS